MLYIHKFHISQSTGNFYTNGTPYTCASLTGDGFYGNMLDGKCFTGFVTTIVILLLFLSTAFCGSVPRFVVIIR